MKRKSSIDNKLIVDVLSSDYEFKRFEKSCLINGISCESWSYFSEPFTEDKGAIESLCQVLLSEIEQKELFCFISSPYWLRDSKIVRYYGLGKFLEKEYKVPQLDFRYEESIKVKSNIVFCGVIQLNRNNLKEIVDLLLRVESGFIFAPHKMEHPYFDEIISAAKRNIVNNVNKASNYLHIPVLINTAVNSGSELIYIHSWQETGSYHLDIFGLSNGSERENQW